MRILDADRGQGVRVLQLYMTANEARELRDHLDALVEDPEASEHRHVCSHDDPSRDLSVSIVTPRKLREGRYTVKERQVLEEP
jgi:hypothetical protein